MEPEFKVIVVNRGRRYLYLQYDDPITGRPVEKSARTADRKEAQKAAGAWEAELREGRFKSNARCTWEEFRRRYEDEVLPGLAESTGKKVAAVFNAIEEHINPARVASLRAAQISLLQSKLRELKRSENTIKSHLAHLKAALRWGQRVGILAAVPNIDMPKRTKTARHRAITREEFERMLQTIPRVVGERRAESWRRFLIGLWWSGLRIEEALRLTWDQEERLMVDLTRRRPMLWIPAAMQKSHKNTLLPLAPEFAEFLLATPEAERTGFVFNPLGWRLNDHGPIKTQQAIRTICAIGVKAGVKVGTNDKGDPQYASAHDCRRAFGDRWSKRVMPAVLKELMRHASINTTMSFYVTGDAQATAELLWESVQVDTLVDTCRFPADPPPSEETEKQHNPL